MLDLKNLDDARQASKANPDTFPLEDQEQAWLIQWCKRHGPTEARRIFAVPNGGHRSRSQGALLKLTGVQKGVPDLCLPVPRNGRHGLWIELKSMDPSSGPSNEQKDWIEYLNGQGYMAVVCRGFEEARDTIIEYLNPPVPPTSPGYI